MYRTLSIALVAASAISQAPVWVHRASCPTQDPGVLVESSGRILSLDVFGELYEYDRAGRQLQRPVSGARPSGRSGHAMAYDAMRDRVVVFGGFDANTRMLDDETWFWDGASWTRSTSAPAPSARSTSMCYDSARDRVVLFGGGDTGNWLRDTWEHDGVRWIARTPTTVPPGGPSALCFDSVRGVTVLVINDFASSTVTYEWDGIDWRLASSSGPPAVWSMAFDASRNRSVLVGASLAGNEVWEWDGAQWTRTGFPVAPARRGPIVVDDPTGGVTVLGGLEVTSFQGVDRYVAPHTDRWEWDGIAMNQIHDDLVPPARLSASWGAMADGTAVLFGGGDALSGLDDTWVWDGANWSRPVTTTAPAARWGAGLASQPTGPGVVLFGGMDGAASPTFLGDTWNWDGTSWTQVVPTGATPSPRADAAMATDTAARTTLLFGGVTGYGRLSPDNDDETWSWDGTSWQQLSPATSPAARSHAAMCWNPVTGSTFLFGGLAGIVPLNDFWVYTGTTWQQLPSGAVPALDDPALVFDPRSNDMLLFGRPWTTGDELQTWSWNGTTWRLVDSVPVTDAGYGGTILDSTAVFHARTGEIAIYDGFGIRMRTTLPALVDSLGGGCGSPAPRLAGRVWPVLGEGAFGLEAAVSPNAPVIFAVGDATQNLLVAPGCRVLVGGQIGALLGVANGAGFASVDVPIPYATSLLGGVAIAQAGVLSPFATSSLDLSNGLRITVGF